MKIERDLLRRGKREKAKGVLIFKNIIHIQSYNHFQSIPESYTQLDTDKVVFGVGICMKLSVELLHTFAVFVYSAHHHRDYRICPPPQIQLHYLWDYEDHL